jgi:predicted lipoprotein with Yx(FWY)xxD motif
MRLPRTTTAVAALAIAFSTAGLAGASTIGKAAPKHPSPSPAARHALPSPTVNTARAVVGGTAETILVNAKGLPLYIYQPDTATKSMVTGELAALWPPLVDSKTPTTKGVTGKLTLVSTQNGRQVAYRGHFLYSFAEDTAGHVTGQGIQNFFVATPGIAAERTVSSAASTSSSATSPASSSSYSSNQYGY